MSPQQCNYEYKYLGDWTIKKLAFITSTRADFGLLEPILQLVNADIKNFELQLIATGTHLSEDHGYTINEIHESGIEVTAEVNIKLGGHSPLLQVQSLASSTEAIGTTINQLDPDFVVLLGDRYEIFASAQAALLLGIPIIHIHGGEITEGAMDDTFRHCITKMATYHFASTDKHAKRIIQMGEDPNSVFVSGAPGLDRVYNQVKIAKDKIEELIGLDLSKPTVLLTYHPVTLSKDFGLSEFIDVLEVLESFSDIQIVATYPNIDTGGDQLLVNLKKFSSKLEERVFLTASLGHVLYLSLLQFVKCVIGNSSSGLIEVPSFEIPTFNIGDRQKGRTSGETVVNITNVKKELPNFLKDAISEKNKLKYIKAINPYGNGKAAPYIVDKIKEFVSGKFQRKSFYDL